MAHKPIASPHKPKATSPHLTFHQSLNPIYYTNFILDPQVVAASPVKHAIIIKNQKTFLVLGTNSLQSALTKNSMMNMHQEFKDYQCERRACHSFSGKAEWNRGRRGHPNIDETHTNNGHPNPSTMTKRKPHVHHGYSICGKKKPTTVEKQSKTD